MKDLHTVGDVCSRDVAVAWRATTLVEAARVMRERHVGCLVVVDETAAGRMVAGMLTDRDIVTAVVARDLAPGTLRVGDVMTDSVATIDETQSLHEAIARMKRRRVRRLPVTDGRGALVGLVSHDDLVARLAGELGALADALSEQRRRETVVRP